MVEVILNGRECHILGPAPHTARHSGTLEQGCRKVFLLPGDPCSTLRNSQEGVWPVRMCIIEHFKHGPTNAIRMPLFYFYPLKLFTGRET